MDCPWFHGMSMAFCAKLPWTFSSYFPPLFCQIYPGQGVQILQAFSMDTFSMDFHGISIEFHGSFTAGLVRVQYMYGTCIFKELQLFFLSKYKFETTSVS